MPIVEDTVPSKKRGKRRWIIPSAAVIIVLGGGAIALANAGSGKLTISQFGTYHVGYGSVSQSVSTSGTLQAASELNLNFTGSTGPLTKVDVKVGQKVKAGQVLGIVQNTSEKIQVQEAKASVTQAQASLQSAQAKLNEATSGGDPTTIALDKENIAKAQATLVQAKQAYSDQQAIFNDPNSNSNAQVTVDQNKVTQDEATLASLQQTNSLTAQQDQAAVATDQQNLTNAEAQYGDVTAAQVNAAGQTYQNELSLETYWGQHYGGATNPYTEPTNTDYANLQTLQTAYNAVHNAQQQLTNDQNKLAQDEASASITNAQNQLNADKQALAQAQAQAGDKATQQQTLDNLNGQITQDQLSLNSAQEQLKLDTSPPDPATLAQDQASVTQAQASLQTAQAQLAAAQNTYDDTILKAPISGVVTAVNGLVGETPGTSSGSSSSSSGSSAFVVLDDLNKSDLQVNIQVPEAQIGSVKAGDAVQLTVDAFPNQTFTGSISQVYPTPQVVSNVTEYTVLATVDNSSGKLKPGMAANVSIQSESATHVLTVPAISLYQLGNTEGVFVVGTPPKRQGGKSAGGFVPKGLKLPSGVYFQPVQLGLFGTGSVQVTSGLTAGEEILRVAPGQAQSISTLFSGGGKGGFGGGRSRSGGSGGGARQGGAGGKG